MQICHSKEEFLSSFFKIIYLKLYINVIHFHLWFLLQTLNKPEGGQQIVS